jgi:formamidopyrimidine-DNA glycosylase
MPELPEVETIVRDLGPHVAGRQLSEVVHLNPQVLRHPTAEDFLDRVPGQTALRVRRRGKFIHLELASQEVLVVHLGMTGTLTVRAPLEPVAPHTHLRLLLSSGEELRYRDPRRFGRVVLGRVENLLDLGHLPKLGEEPLDEGFPSARVHEVMRTSRRPVKAILLDQSVIAGCGNIYADEACYLARIRPSRRAYRLSAAERRRLLAALPVVMGEAVQRRGTSFSDYRDGFGAKGEAFETLLVYGRGGSGCARCGSTLRQSAVAGRTTVFCVRCQL